jgi:ribosomal protein S27AE
MPSQTETAIKEEKQEIEENPAQPQPKTTTVKQRIDGVIDKYIEDKDELKKQVFQLVQRVLYPEQFCPNCDERMFFNSDTVTYKCPNCDYTTTVTVANSTAKVAIPTAATPRGPAGSVPPQVEKAIAEAEEAMKDTPIRGKTTPIGDKIRKLVNDRDAGGPSAPTKDDEARVKNSSSNVANQINWV